MWRLALRKSRSGVRRLCSSSSAAVRGLPTDEGDWAYADEWWGDGGHTVFRSASEHGNGVVSVVSHPSSRPAREQWPAIERSMQRYQELLPNFENAGKLWILGYQWRVLHFNDHTRQSTAKVMAAYRESDPHSLLLMQQPHCLAVPYLKSVVSAGLTTLASSGYDIYGAVTGSKSTRVLCIGHGGGSLPLFLASKIKGAKIDIVEIDPVVITASVQAMGFPASSLRERSTFDRSANADELLWGSLHHRLFLHTSDAEDFVRESSDIYDLVFIDAYDGDDIFPWKLWDPQGAFLESLRSRVNPAHGTVVVNLHSDSEVLGLETNDHSISQSILPMGGYVSQVCKAYKEHFGMAYLVSVPWLCNMTLVSFSGARLCADLCVDRQDIDKNRVLDALVSKCHLVEDLFDLPFPCLPYIKRGLVLVD
ncbi:uncharacterized protein LOC121970995 [Zingiber officinale]|uniref:S-adenosyl-L-methionine-dependent methyltransferase superfamily protein n=1 Tax=Zingiber officinale TaxID=94328 RepID=A0A8J5H2I3_ZINOF|nr:uncharacterized protein LOC121970995 [Zingiber officinale]KAG6515451.1 hypothetical protein ZIOFF_025863 [Zingiber officinale]